jgi:hypothetical protein
MADQHPHQGRRQHFHRGRRGHDRRGERRPSQTPQGQPSGGPDAPQPDQVDVDQIVRDIKARISQRHGIDLSAQQIQELAARRLEAILDPRTVKPGLLDQLRKAAGAPADIAPAEPADAYTFEDHTIYDTHNGLLRFLRKLFNPLLKLFFNPNPISAALHTQAEVNRAAARREAERERTQAEWNALHYTLLQRLVTEVSRVSLEIQSLALRVESLSTRTDFTERRIRGLESVPAPPAIPSRSFDAPATAPSSPAPRNGGESGTGDGSSEGRRRRRRRRGRRGPGAGGDAMTGAGAALSPSQNDAAEGDDDPFDEGPDTEMGDGAEGIEADTPSSGNAGEPAAVEMAPPPHAPEPAPVASTAPTPAPPAPQPSSPPADAPRDSSITPPVTDPSGT